MSKTADKTASLFHPKDKKFQERARRAFPILVRQANAGQPITYGQLALELNMRPRNLGKVLGCIGNTIREIAADRQESIPPLQSIVINKNTQLPGEGFNSFMDFEAIYSRSTIQVKRQLLATLLARVFNFPDWNTILESLNIQPVNEILSDLVKQAKLKPGFGGGESPEHLLLKNWVYNNPSLIGLDEVMIKREIEFRFASHDEADVVFHFQREIVVIEVKTKSAEISELTRGFFQVVKYNALMEAEQKLKSNPISIRTILVLEGSLPQELIGLRNVLGIEVIEEIQRIIN
jgi:hypothetical protein